MDIPIPYTLSEWDLVIDGAAKGSSLDAELSAFNVSINRQDPDMVERIMRSTVLLHEKTKAPLGECLGTALIWENG